MKAFSFLGELSRKFRAIHIHKSCILCRFWALYNLHNMCFYLFLCCWKTELPYHIREDHYRVLPQGFQLLKSWASILQIPTEDCGNLDLYFSAAKVLLLPLVLPGAHHTVTEVLHQCCFFYSFLESLQFPY